MKHLNYPWPELLLYVSGAMCIGLGVALCVASLDPRPLPVDIWWYLLSAGAVLIAAGIFLLGLICRLPAYPKSFFTDGRAIGDMTAASVAELLDESDIPVFNDSPTVELKNADFSFDDSDHTPIPGRSNTLQSMTSTTSSIFFYKETYV